MTSNPLAPPSNNITITKTDAPDPVPPGTELTYPITATNNGPSDATPTITDAIPSNTTFVRVVAAGWSCTGPTGGVVSCTSLTTLASGATSSPITLVVKVNHSASK